MESIREYLGAILGETKIHVAYVIHESVGIPGGTDPTDAYVTVEEEMIARDPHGTPTYRLDNKTVWEHMSNISRSHDFWVYIKPAQHSKDGIYGFVILFKHYLGPNNVTNMAIVADLLRNLHC
jgi:hypothetical protein